MVIDGKLGFTGGAGIADEWLGNADNRKHWRDCHYRVQGPVVGQLQAAFCDNWMQTTGRVLEGDNYFPKLDKFGDQLCQMFRSSSTGGSENMELLFLLSMAGAGHDIRMESAYFDPDALTRKRMWQAVQRGVKLQIIVPGANIDEKLVRTASRAHWGELLKGGIEIYEYQPTMIHCKLMIVDDIWTTIGSANMDNRSFRINDEANLNVYDEKFAIGANQELRQRHPAFPPDHAGALAASLVGREGWRCAVESSGLGVLAMPGRVSEPRRDRFMGQLASTGDRIGHAWWTQPARCTYVDDGMQPVRLATVAASSSGSTGLAI